MSEPDFWTNKERAQQRVEEVSTLRGKVTPLLDLGRKVEDLEVLIELATEDPENGAAEVATEYGALTNALAEQMWA